MNVSLINQVVLRWMLSLQAALMTACALTAADPAPLEVKITSATVHGIQTLDFPSSHQVSIVDIQAEVKNSVGHAKVEAFADDLSLGVRVDIPTSSRPENRLAWEWVAPARGKHVLVVTAADSAGREVKSEPFGLIIPSNPTTSFLKFAKPQNGDTFHAGDNIGIVLESSVPGGYLDSAEVLLNGKPIGNATYCCPACRCIRPTPGAPLTLTLWTGY
ncbi:MAG: hypothetical protein EXS36_18415, partial [Pedosphaera sp.]|nr:hypothetical protein [Pedosphaera sp.]